MSYKITAYFNDSGISQTRIATTVMTYTKNYGDSDLQYSGFTGMTRFTATAASGYSFYRWVYRLNSVSGTVQYSYSNPFDFTQEKDIYIRAESQSSGGGGGGGEPSSWSVTSVNLGTITSAQSKSITLSAGSVYRYQFNCTGSGSMTLRTSGSLDTIGYLSTSTSFNSSTGKPSSYLAEDDDSGQQYNFAITYSVSANTTYYLYVRCLDISDSGSLTVLISTPPTGGQVDTYSLGTISSTQSKSITINENGVAEFIMRFKYKGTATFYTTGSLDTLGFLSLSNKWDKTKREPFSYLKKDDDSGSGSNFKITYDVEADTSYYVYVRLYSSTSTGSLTFYVEPPAGVKKWDWNAQNVNASAAVTKQAKNALYQGGTVSNFSYAVWNDLCDKVLEIRQYIGGDWNNYYATLNNTKMTTSSKTLTAIRFNSLRYNIGEKYSTGIAEVKKGDTVKASYFITLAQKINDWIDTL